MEHVQKLLRAAPSGFVRWPCQDNCFLPTLEKSPELAPKRQQLGISVGEHAQLLKILDVSEEGLVSMWNVANPTLRVAKNAYIMEVNGARGTPEELIQCMKALLQPLQHGEG